MTWSATTTGNPLGARDERLEARSSAEQQRPCQRVVDSQGRTPTDFVLASTHEVPVRTIEAMQTIRLTEAESRAFAEALLAPREPAARLKAAAKRHSGAVER